MKLKTLALLLLSAGLVMGCRQSLEPEDAEGAKESLASQLQSILEGDHRSDENKHRDQYRHPVETLRFFDISAKDTVLEINPGGGWYMEVLGPLLNDQGQYVAVTPNPELEGMPSYVASQATQIQERIDQQAQLYGQAKIQFYNPSEPTLGEPGSADTVLTFRNVHGWINAGMAEEMFDAFAEVLKTGGVLGVVQHRAPEGANPEQSAGEGYVAEEVVIQLAEAAGFKLEARSEINANPKDSREHPHGVWTLPPVLRLGDESREEYLKVGESDRMTLRFVKQ